MCTLRQHIITVSLPETFDFLHINQALKERFGDDQAYMTHLATTNVWVPPPSWEQLYSWNDKLTIDFIKSVNYIHPDEEGDFLINIAIDHEDYEVIEFLIPEVLISTVKCFKTDISSKMFKLLSDAGVDMDEQT